MFPRPRPELQLVSEMLDSTHRHSSHRELVSSIKKELMGDVGSDLLVSPKDFTPDVLDIVVLAKLSPVMSIVAMEHAKQAVREQGGDMLVWLRRIALDLKKE